MTQATIYHNPRCSKSRATLALLQQKNCEIKVVEYLKEPLDKPTLLHILKLLDLEPRQIMRTHEAEYKAQQLQNTELSQDDLVQAIIDCPKLLERPIVLVNNKAAIGRPLENVTAIL